MRRLTCLLVCGLLALPALRRLARSVGTWLVVSDPIAKADALLLTYAAAERRDGVDLAARLYATGVVPCILAASLGGPEVEPLLTPPAGELARSALTQRGVMEAAIQLLPPSDGEAALAESVRDGVVGRRWWRMIVVTTDYRSRRTALAMRGAPGEAPFGRDQPAPG